MPEHDTYKAIERYARDNSNPAAVLGYLMLKRRTELSLLWKAKNSDYETSTALRMYLGMPEVKSVVKDMRDMPEQDRLDMFMAACSSVGIELDPSTFKK